MEPWPDQWAFLSSVSRMSADAVVALADTVQPVTAGPNLSLADLASADGPKPPERIDAQIAGCSRSGGPVYHRRSSPGSSTSPRCPTPSSMRRNGCGSRLGTRPGSSVATAKTSNGSTSQRSHRPRHRRVDNAGSRLERHRSSTQPRRHRAAPRQPLLHPPASRRRRRQSTTTSP